MKKILCFIPARKNSKSIKNKNLIKIKNKSLIYYTLAFAKKFKNFDIFLSTDSLKIKNYAKKNFNVYNKYLRPASLASDSSRIIDAIIHCVNWLKNKNIFYDTVILLQPTNPVRNINEVKKALSIFKKKKYKSLVSLTAIREHPFDTITLNKKKWNYLIKKPKKTSSNRQSYKKKYYFIDGNFYIANINFLKKNKSFLIKNETRFFIQKKKWPIDIDYPDDIRVAKVFL